MNKTLILIFSVLGLLSLVNCSSISIIEKSELNCIHHCELDGLRFYGLVAGQCVCAKPRTPLYPDIP